MRIIQIDKLQPGMVLASPIYGSDGKLLLTRNVVLKDVYMRRLSDLKVGSVYIYDELSEDINVENVLRTKTIARAYAACKKKSFDSCMLVASMIVDDMINHIEDLPNMAALQAYDNYTFLHSMNVGILSGMVGIEMNFTQERLVDLVVAGLLHDIGKSDIPPEIIQKKGALTKEEIEVMRRHPEFGYLQAKDSTIIPATVKHTILYHHENYDGSGYPAGKSGDELHVFARIVHVCDVYDAMTSKRCYKEAINPADVIEYLMSGAGTMFDRDCLIAFKRSVFPYATGSVVVLSNGEIAIVKENFKGLPERPDVKLVSTGEIISLREVNNIVIQGTRSLGEEYQEEYQTIVNL